MAQLMPLPLTVSCFSEIQIGFPFLIAAHLGCPGKRAVKRVCVCIYLWVVHDSIVLFVQVSYAIGVAEPLSIFISSYGTGIKSDSDLLKIVKANFDLRPGKIVKYVCLFAFLYFVNVVMIH